jgi:hypothetical protein
LEKIKIINLFIQFINESDEEKRQNLLDQIPNKSIKFREGKFKKFIKFLINKFKIQEDLLIDEINSTLELEIEKKKKPKKGTPKKKDFSSCHINKTFFKAKKLTPAKSEYRTRSATKNKELAISHFQVEFTTSPFSALFNNTEYSRLSFESNIKRPYSLNQGCSSAKTLSYSSYYSNASQFSFGPNKMNNLSESCTKNSTYKATGINSLLSFKTSTLPKHRKTRTSSSKKKHQKKSYLLELIESKLKSSVEEQKKITAKTSDLIPLKKAVSKRFYKKQEYLHSSSKKIDFEDEVFIENNLTNDINIEITDEDLNSNISIKTSLLAKKRPASPIMTRSAYKKSRKNSKSSYFTDDEIIEYCTPILMRAQEYQMRESPRRNLSNLFKQINK